MQIILSSNWVISKHDQYSLYFLNGKKIKIAKKNCSVCLNVNQYESFESYSWQTNLL